ncbi:MAG: glycosyltransferase family 2 protein [Candidatus Bipolaricaulaceae bacterium]
MLVKQRLAHRGAEGDSWTGMVEVSSVAMNALVVVPVHNEETSLGAVLAGLQAAWSGGVLVVDDGSTDATPHIAREQGAWLVQHADNRGYGAALRSGFAWATARGYTWAVTLDADGQHEPSYLRLFLDRAATGGLDVISGSRYLDASPALSPVPQDRRWVNGIVTRLLCDLTGLALTDAFCGFRAYRLAALTKLELTEDGYGFPMEFWIKAAHLGLAVEGVPVPLVYHDFAKGVGRLPARARLAHYLAVAADALRWTCSS